MVDQGGGVIVGYPSAQNAPSSFSPGEHPAPARPRLPPDLGTVDGRWSAVRFGARTARRAIRIKMEH